MLVGCGYYFWSTIDNGDAKYYNMNSGITCFEKDQEELTDKDGKKYIVMTITNFGYDEFLEHRTKLQEVKKKFLATMPNLDEMSDYEKVLGILSFMSYIKYGFDEKGNTIDDAYTTLTGGKATCGGFSEAFNFLAKAINLQSEKIRNPGVHAWNVVKICGKWYEVEPQSKNNPTQSDATRNMNMKSVLRGTTTMAEKGSPCEYGDLRESLPVSETDYMDYKEHNYTNHVIKWNGNKATFYKTCSDCGEYENDGFEYNSKYKYYHLVDRKYTGTDCDVTKVSETKCGDATVTKYEASVTVDGKNYTSEHTVIDGECSHTVKDSDIKVIRKATCSEEGEIEKTCETCGYTWTESTPKIEHQYIELTWINNYVNANPNLLKQFFSVKEKIKAFKVRKNSILEKSKTNYEIKKMIDDRQKHLLFMAAEDMVVNGLGGGKIQIISSGYDLNTAKRYLQETYNKIVLPAKYGQETQTSGGGFFGKNKGSAADADLARLLRDASVEEMLCKSEWLWNQHNDKGLEKPTAEEATYAVACLVKVIHRMLDKKGTSKAASSPNKKVIITKTGKVIELSDESGQSPVKQQESGVIEAIDNIVVLLKDKSEENVKYVKAYIEDLLNALMKTKWDKDTMLSQFDAEELRAKSFQVIKRLNMDMLV